MRPIKFDVPLPSSGADFALLRAFAERAEALGFYSISMADHFFLHGLIWDYRQPNLECFTTLSALAALTNRIRLNQAVTCMGYRNPALLAKMTSTLDQISDGRLIVGVGAGWFRDEFLANNYAFPSNAERIDQLAEGIKVLKAMWTQDEPTFHGRYFSIDKAYNFPKPIQKPHPPLMIGGSGKLMMPLSAREADIANFVPPVTAGMLIADQWSNFDRSKMKTRITMLRELAQKEGRDPDQIEISALCFCFISASASEARGLYRQALNGMGIEAPPDPETLAPKVLVGTPKEISRQVRSVAEDLGITYFGPIFGPSLDALELFGRKVLPEFSTV